MTSSNRLMLCCLVLLIVHGATVFRSGAVMAQQPAAGSSLCASMVFTASDFPALAGGIEVRTSGDAVAQVWSPASQEWRLSQDGDAVNLRSLENGGDPLPRWQKLGKVVLRAGIPSNSSCRERRSQRLTKPRTRQRQSRTQNLKATRRRRTSRPPSRPCWYLTPTREPTPSACSTSFGGVLILPDHRPIAAAPRSGRTRREPTSSRRRRPRPGANARCSSVSRCSWRSASGRCRRRRP